MSDDIKYALSLIKSGLNDLEYIKGTALEVNNIADNALTNFRYAESLIEKEISKEEGIHERV